MRSRQPAWAAALVIFMAPVMAAVADSDMKEDYTDQFPLGDCTFSSTGGNTWIRLAVNRQLYLAGEEDGDLVELWITVLPGTHTVTVPIDGQDIDIHTRVVEERETANGELVEVSRNFMAECMESGDVYYFGEDVDNYADGQLVDHGGSWEAGVDGALPGIMMPATYLLGARYYQEVAPDIALDRAEHEAMGLDIAVPAGAFQKCVMVEETTPLERKDISIKEYCPGVGLVRDDVLELQAVMN